VLNDERTHDFTMFQIWGSFTEKRKYTIQNSENSSSKSLAVERVRKLKFGREACWNIIFEFWVASFDILPSSWENVQKLISKILSWPAYLALWLSFGSTCKATFLHGVGQVHRLAIWSGQFFNYGPQFSLQWFKVIFYQNLELFRFSVKSNHMTSESFSVFQWIWLFQ